MVERYSQRTGFEVGDISYYRAFQAWRLAAIVEGVLNRYLQGVMGDDSVDTDQYKLQVEGLVGNALELLNGSSS
jgi:aminoglycoside phosphotransferase (APT) family kinase protein